VGGISGGMGFRDNALNDFYNSQRYQDMILEKFGIEILQHIKDMLKYKLKRKLLGDCVSSFR